MKTNRFTDVFFVGSGVLSVGLWFLVGFTILISPACLFATNGYFPVASTIPGHGTAGAGTGAVAGGGAMGGVFNPANLAFLPNQQIHAGLTFFSPNRGYTVEGNGGRLLSLDEGTYKSAKRLFVIPAFGQSWTMRDGSTLAFSFCGNGGMNTDYHHTVYPGGSGSTGVNLAQA
jgi:long-subunit fatty acid transport protein